MLPGGDDMQIWGHRGAYSERPENTLHAFARAVELGVDGVERDIQLSKDGEAVVIHDERIDRVSNGVGWVGDYTLQELKKFNFNKKQISEPKFMEIPTLREVLELLKPHNNIKINIELKTGARDYYLIEEKTIALVKEYGLLERVLFSSFNHFTMQILKYLEPNAKIGLLCGGAVINTARECLALGASALNMDARAMRLFGIVEEAVTLGIEVNIWGTKSAEDLLYAKEKMVNAVIVNNIADAMNVLQNAADNAVQVNNAVNNGILCWYPFAQNSSVLDLSDGFLTALLKEKCGKILDESSDEKADYAVVFEPKEISSSYLQNLYSRLKPAGKLLLVFENPYGIKKICRESFNIRNSTDREQIKEMLKYAGFRKQKWYYPLGNHRAALEVFSDNFMPNEFLGNKPFHGLFQNEICLLQHGVKTGILEHISSGYLVEALVSETDENCEADYAKITLYRSTDKRFATVLNSGGTVKKEALCQDAKPRLKNICENHRILNELGIAAVPVNLEPDGNSVSMQKYSEPVLWDYWLEKIKAGKLDENEMLEQFDCIRDSIFRVFEKTKKCFWELVPANAFYNEAKKQMTFFDQEFSSENMDPNVAVVRAIQAIKYQPLLDEWNSTSGMYEKLQERYFVKENFNELLDIAEKTTYYVFRG
jgi:glycerophosphoryl diester phosphodiesterase